MATIRDVARAAGVSIATVSRALNGSSRVTEETRGRVRTAVAELGYWPNSAARSLTQDRTLAIGILLPDLYDQFFSEVIRGIDLAARRARHQIMISSSHASADELLSAARSMRGRVDGLIIMASDEEASAINEIRRRFPVVLLNPRVSVAGCAAVSVANTDGAHAVTTHLIGLGHRSIAMIQGPSGNADADERRRGYRRALHDAGIEPSTSLEIEGDFTESAGFRAAETLLEHVPRPSAVFAANDAMAIGLLSALHTRGVAVPEELAVTGFDGIAISAYTNPPLTTVRVDACRLGARAVELLVSPTDATGAAGPTTDHSPIASGNGRCEVLPAMLVVRGSCGAAEPREESVPIRTQQVRARRPGRQLATRVTQP